MTMNTEMHFILHSSEKTFCRCCSRVIVNGCGINICNFLIKATLRKTNLPNAFQLLLKIIFCQLGTTIFQPFIIHYPALNSVVLHDCIGPFPKLNCALIIDFKSYRNNHLQIIMFGVIGFPIRSSY